MFQEITVGIIFLSAITYLVYKLFPGMFGLKKANNGCVGCDKNVDVVKEVRKISQDI